MLVLPWVYSVVLLGHAEYIAGTLRLRQVIIIAIFCYYCRCCCNYYDYYYYYYYNDIILLCVVSRLAVCIVVLRSWLSLSEVTLFTEMFAQFASLLSASEIALISMAKFHRNVTNLASVLIAVMHCRAVVSTYFQRIAVVTLLMMAYT